MKKALAATQKHFESSSSRTPEYLQWYRLFKREFIAFLESKGVMKETIQISKPNHFDMSGFFCKLNKGVVQIWYFSISDLRYSKNSMLIRTAQSYKDYTGGHNMYIPLDNGVESFEKHFEKIVLTLNAKPVA